MDNYAAGQMQGEATIALVEVAGRVPVVDTTMVQGRKIQQVRRGSKRSQSVAVEQRQE